MFSSLRILTAFAAFIEYAYKKPVWIIATIAVGSCLTFIASFQFTASSEEPRLQDIISQRQIVIEDTERIIELYKQAVSLAEPTDAVFAGFMKILDEIKKTEQLTGYEQQVEGLRRSQVATRHQLEEVVASFKGTKLRTSYLEENLRAAEQFLVAVTAFLWLVQDVTGSYRESDPSTFARQLLDSSARFREISLQVRTSLAAIESARLSREGAVRAERVELQRAISDVRLYRLKRIFQIPAGLFVLVYAVVLFASVRDIGNKISERRSKSKTKRKRRGK